MKYNISGYLCYNNNNNRYGIKDDKGEWLYEGLHCGDGLWAYINDEWLPTRIEFTSDDKGEWYLIDINRKPLDNISVRM